MAYADDAAEKLAPKQKEAPVVNQTKGTVAAPKKSFEEQLLDQALQQDPKAIEKYAQDPPSKAEKTATGKKAASAEEDKSIYE